MKRCIKRWTDEDINSDNILIYSSIRGKVINIVIIITCSFVLMFCQNAVDWSQWATHFLSQVTEQRDICFHE